MYPLDILRVKDQGRTKDEPRMNQRTSKYKMCVLLRLSVSISSLIPYLILPTDDRENSERRAERYRALAAKNSALVLRLSPKKVDFIPKKVVLLPKKVDCFPEIVAYPPNKKSPQKAIFLAHLKKKVYLCSQMS